MRYLRSTARETNGDVGLFADTLILFFANADEIHEIRECAGGPLVYILTRCDREITKRRPAPAGSFRALLNEEAARTAVHSSSRSTRTLAALKADRSLLHRGRVRQESDGRSYCGRV